MVKHLTERNEPALEAMGIPPLPDALRQPENVCPCQCEICDSRKNISGPVAIVPDGTSPAD